MGILLRLIKYIVIAVILLVIFLTLVSLVFENADLSLKNLQYGVSFSPRYARYLNLNWQKVYIDLLDNLKIRNLRLPSYWTSLEPQRGQFDFTETDFMLYEAEKRGAKVIMVVGLRQPRWPECHVPFWAKNLSVEERQQEILRFVGQVVEKYKTSPSIKAWQIENEPYVSWFGDNCDKPDKKFISAEIKLVKELDKRPIILTDSGEWSFWGSAMGNSDILGVSLYRKTYSPLFGYVSYPFPVAYYAVKSSAGRVFAQNNQKTIITELQTEPWVQKAVPDTPIDEQTKLFSVNDFENNIKFAQKTAFEEIYLWGVEWWYWMDQNGQHQYLDFAKTIFSTPR